MKEKLTLPQAIVIGVVWTGKDCACRLYASRGSFELAACPTAFDDGSAEDFAHFSRDGRNG